MSKRKMSNRIGDISELKVATYYLENGYEVFRNVCSTGLIDLVVSIGLVSLIGFPGIEGNSNFSQK